MKPRISSSLPAIAASGFIFRKSESFGGVSTRGTVIVGRVPVTAVETDEFVQPRGPMGFSERERQIVSMSSHQPDRLVLAAWQSRIRVLHVLSVRYAIPRSRILPDSAADRRRTRAGQQCDKRATARE